MQMIRPLLLALAIAWPLAHANMVGSSQQSFNPTTSGLDFVTVQSARTLPSGALAVGGFLDYAWNTLPPALDVRRNKVDVETQAFSSDFHFGLGLLQRWEVGASISTDIHAEADAVIGDYYERAGMTDMRANTKFHLLGEGSEGLAINLTANFPQTEDDPFYGGSSDNVYNAELVGELKMERVLLALNGGYRFRSPGPAIPNAPYEPIGDQWIGSAALAYRFYRSNLSFIAELFSSIPVDNTPNYDQEELTGLEVLGGLKYIGIRDLSLHTGVTTGLMAGTSSPDFRVYAGMNWYPARLWGKTKATPRPAPTSTGVPEEEVAPPEAPSQEGALGHIPIAGEEEVEAAMEEPVAAAPAEPVADSTADDLSVFEKQPVAKVERFIVRNINFKTASAEVPPSFMPYLEKLNEYLKKGGPLKRLMVYGHTDSVGTATYNQSLSQRRAISVKNVLVKKFKIPSFKIEPVGMGEIYPVATNATPEGRARNRRVEFKIERE